VLGSVQNRDLMECVFFKHRPHTVFHAAAYKHVPMMEAHPWEAVFNNVLGSQTIIDLCEKAAVGRCVIVSTDKAVRPTNVMGATKRMVEKFTQCYAPGSRCRFMAVRFGNVLGSSGSVLPVFKRQIAVGGPVTVTHPEVTRYFMTIPEACSLILQAGAIGSGNEIFVLKMGTPVRIDTMARDLITLSGFTPDLDISVEYTGLRPGEKLYEELITEEEDIQRTNHEDIMVLRGNGCLPKEVMMQHLKELVGYARKQDGDKIREKLCEVVPEYCIQKPEETVGKVIPLQRRAVAGELAIGSTP
jgi:FlaA1/EpsC-like NDP-sugar epimerase